MDQGGRQQGHTTKAVQAEQGVEFRHSIDLLYLLLKIL